MRIWLPLLLVVGQCLCAVIPQRVPGKTTIVSTPSCKGSSCHCPPGLSGNPEFFCYQPGSQVLSISGETITLKDWNNNTGELLFPGRIRLTEFITKQADTTNQQCHFQIIGETSLVQGRLLIVGVDVNFRRLSDDGQERTGVGTRMIGVAQGKFTQFTEWGRSKFVYERQNQEEITGIQESATQASSFEGLFLSTSDDEDLASGSGSGAGDFDGNTDSDSQAVFTKFGESRSNTQDEWGNPVQLDVGGERIGWVVGDDHIARLSVSTCATEVVFRPSDQTSREEERVPGLAVVLASWADVIFPNVQDYAGGSLVNSKHIMLNQNSLLHSTMIHAPPQDTSTATGNLIAETSSIYRSTCTSKGTQAKAMKQCSLILRNPMTTCLYEDYERSSWRNEDDSLAILTKFQSCLLCTCSLQKDVCFQPPAKCNAVFG